MNTIDFESRKPLPVPAPGPAQQQQTNGKKKQPPPANNNKNSKTEAMNAEQKMLANLKRIQEKTLQLEKDRRGNYFLDFKIHQNKQ